MNPDEHLLPVEHSNGDLFICDVADVALKDLNPQMEHRFAPDGGGGSGMPAVANEARLS